MGNSIGQLGPKTTRRLPALESEQASASRTRRAVFEWLAIVTMLVVGLNAGRSLLIPLSLAIFLTFLLSPAVTALRRLDVPRGLAVGVVTFSAFLVLASLSLVIGRQLTHLAHELPRYQATMTAKIKALKDMTSLGGGFDKTIGSLKTIRGELTGHAEPADQTAAADASVSTRATAVSEPDVAAPAETGLPWSALQSLAATVGDWLATAGIVTVFLIMTLYSREDVRDRAIRLLGVNDLERTTRAMDDAGARLNQYFLRATLLNAGFGAIIAVGLALIGVPNALLWGFIAMLLRFIPFLGVPLAAVVPLALAFVTAPGWQMFALTAALFIVSEVIVSQAIEPHIQGEATGLSPLAIIVATAFWTLLWGPVGLLLSVPLTVILVVLGRHVEHLAFLDVLLGSEPALSPADRFYQRILAGDAEEAADMVATDTEFETRASFDDAVVLEALRKAARDAKSGRFDAERLDELGATLDHFDELVGELPAPDNNKEGGANRNTADASQRSAMRTDGNVEALRPRVLCVAARSPLDLAAARLLAQRLPGQDRAARAVMASEVPALVSAGELAGIETICLSAFDVGPNGSHVKFLVRRLRRLLPQARVVGAFWTQQDGVERIAVNKAVGIEETAASFASARDVILRPHVEEQRILTSAG